MSSVQSQGEPEEGVVVGVQVQVWGDIVDLRFLDLKMKKTGKKFIRAWCVPTTGDLLMISTQRIDLASHEAVGQILPRILLFRNVHTCGRFWRPEKLMSAMR